MAVRSSMAGLITRVSTLIDDAGNATFTQQEVQDALDGTRITHVYLLLQPVPLFSSGWRYTAFVSPCGDLSSRSRNDKVKRALQTQTFYFGKNYKRLARTSSH